MTREEEIINAGIDYTISTCPVCIGGAALMKNKIVESLDKVVTDALEFNTDDWADHLNYLDNALVKIQDMYEHDNW